MTLVLDERSTVPQDVPARRWRRLLGRVALLTVVVLVVAWSAVGKQPPLEPGGWSSRLDARPLEDGVTTTRYVLSVDAGAQVVATSVRNDGPLPVTLLGIDEEHSVPWARARFRDRGPTPRSFGFASAAEAKAAVTASSLRLQPGSSADVLVTFEPPDAMSLSGGSYTELYDLLLSVRYLGVDSSQRVPLLMEPLTFVGGDAVAQLEREGRFGD